MTPSRFEQRRCQALWAQEKYRVLRSSQKIYLEIREYLKEPEPTFVHLEELIARAYERKPQPGSIINAISHVWGHFKKRVQVEEKEQYLELLSQFERGEAEEEQVWQYLKNLLKTYPDPYLEASSIWQIQGGHTSLS